jgi:hypothetical protein
VLDLVNPQLAVEGGSRVFVGRHDAMNPAAKVRERNDVAGKVQR